MPHLVIMAAGTGGHIIPGIAVAREVQRRGWTVSWLGTATGMENRLVPPTHHGFELLRPLPIVVTELAVAIPLGMGLPILHPQQAKRHALAAQFLMNRGPVRLRNAPLGSRCLFGKQPFIQLFRAEPFRQWPA